MRKPDTLRRELVKVSGQIDTARRRLDELEARRLDLLLEARDETNPHLAGYKGNVVGYRDLGDWCGLTNPRVHQIVTAHRKKTLAQV